MSIVTLKGTEFNTNGSLPEMGSKIKDFSLVSGDLSLKNLEDFKGSNLIFNIFPSVDTGTCAASVRNFNKTASNLKNTKVLCVSRDLPFAQGRFCGAEGIENVVMLSDFNSGAFGTQNGLNFIDGPLNGLNSRSIIVTDKNGIILYTEQIAETVDEPNYEAALSALK
jgi:thiol peroxidase